MVGSSSMDDLFSIKSFKCSEEQPSGIPSRNRHRALIGSGRRFFLVISLTFRFAPASLCFLASTVAATGYQNISEQQIACWKFDWSKKYPVFVLISRPHQKPIHSELSWWMIPLTRWVFEGNSDGTSLRISLDRLYFTSSRFPWVLKVQFKDLHIM